MLGIKSISLTLLLVSTAAAQSIGVNIPMSAIRGLGHPRQLVHKINTNKGWMVTSVVLLELANATDFATTRYALFPGQPGYGHYCELNPLLSNGCQLNIPRFAAAKLGIATLGITELVGGLKADNRTLNLSIILTNIGFAIPLVLADVNNVRALTK